MTTNDIAALTSRLEQLRLERERINQEEGELLSAIRRASLDPNTADETTEDNPSTTTEPTGTFRVGQRVLITNRVTHVPADKITIKDRAAVITGFTAAGKIKLKTYRGHKTWRNPGNLRELTDEAHERIIREQ